MRYRKLAAAGLLLAWLGGRSTFADPVEPRAILQAPIAKERVSPVSAVPFDLVGRKIVLDASVNGVQRQFIFDTGSPTILSSDLARSLGLEVVAQNNGRDANGTEVTMDIAVVNSLQLGDVVFRDVPVLIHDFSDLSLGPCLIDGGIIGSEIFPESAWQIDAVSQTLTIAEDASLLGLPDTAVSVPLFDFGYPHAPIVDYSVGKLDDKALFDTGSAEDVALFTKVMDSREVRKAAISGSKRTGRGYGGESAGGLGEPVELSQLRLETLEIGGHGIGPVRAMSRPVPPSLIGMGLLDRYTVVLDFPGKAFTMVPRPSPAPVRPARDYSIMMIDGDASVAQLYKGEQADKAGLKLGDTVIAVNGKPLSGLAGDAFCEAAHWLINEFDPSAANELTVMRDGGPVNLQIPGSGG